MEACSCLRDDLVQDRRVAQAPAGQEQTETETDREPEQGVTEGGTAVCAMQSTYPYARLAGSANRSSVTSLPQGT